MKQLWYWWLDYVYVIKRQLKSLLSRESPSRYRVEGGAPVVLIPGVYENWRFVQPVAKALHDEGYDVHVITELGFNRGTVEEMAHVVARYISTNHLRGVTLVAHSKGGLIGKLLLSIVDDHKVVKKLLAIHTPFSGSRYAYILPFKSLRVFTPRSKVLTALALDHLNNARVVSIYGLFDPHIPGGSHLQGAKNIQLKTYGHFRILSEPAVHRAILTNIDERSDTK